MGNHNEHSKITWEFFKDSTGKWWWVKKGENPSFSTSKTGFGKKNICIEDAKKYGYKPKDNEK